jgi:glucan phosphoethanolaminetransferase (alkaline phosphatase superfamily)
MLITYALIHAGFVAAAVIALFWLREPAHRSIFFGLALIASTAVTVAVFGAGNYWSLPSLMGKLFANLLGSAVPLVAVAGAFAAMRNPVAPTLARGTIALLGGAIGIVLSPLVALVSACTLTGDCP